MKKVNRRKDSGFTLIELMIVIAVIGILAIVLIPRVGTVKTQAKEAGLDTNVRLVQGYVESKIDKWVSNKRDRTAVVTDIVEAFTFGNNEDSKKLVNPITGLPGNAVSTALSSISTNAEKEPLIVLTEDNPTPGNTIGDAEGSVVVAIKGSQPIDSITIYAYGTGGKQLTEKTVTITR